MPTLLWFDGPNIFDGKKDFNELSTKNNVLSILEWIMGFVDPLWGPDEDLLKNEEAKTGAANSHETSGVNLEDDENVKEAPSGNHGGVINIESSEDLSEVHSKKEINVCDVLCPMV